MSIVLRPEFVCTSSRHTYAAPHPSYFAFLHFTFRSVSLAFSWGFVGWTTACGCSWCPVPWPVSVWFIPLQRTSAVPAIRITFVLVPPILQTGDHRPNSSFCELVVQVLYLSTYPTYAHPPLCVSFSPLNNSVVCGIYDERSVCIHSCAHLESTKWWLGAVGLGLELTHRARTVTFRFVPLAPRGR